MLIKNKKNYQSILLVLLPLFLLGYINDSKPKDVKGQSIKDYFIPDSAYNMMSYYCFGQNGVRADMSIVIYYVKRGTTYEITRVTHMQGLRAAIWTMTIQFISNEVQMIKKISTSMLKTYQKTEYNPPNPILKMPPADQTISIYKDSTGANMKGTASWTTVNVDGKERKAIKLVKQFEGFPKVIEYYVKGIGFWKSEIEGDEGFYTFQNINEMGYDPSAKDKFNFPPPPQDSNK